ncbi:MAG: aminotransferase class III-fold pyridoxal phosphate-dependent enzyme, partial [Lachnospiraceae bacterium]|nr:aminotransferase class III-fold pyridoxal phosphate-dependent enzyme [Lachnospiraceae bacterium]
EHSLVPGDHGTTYGGNPFVLAAVRTSIRLMRERKLPEHVRELTPEFEKVLEVLADSFDFVLKRRGRGFMQGLVLDERVPAGQVVAKALEEGLIILSAGGNVLRFLPPLVAQKQDMLSMQEILSKVLKGFI